MLSGEGADIIEQAKVGLVCKPGDYKELTKNVLKLKNLDKKKSRRHGREWPNIFKSIFSKRNAPEQTQCNSL